MASPHPRTHIALFAALLLLSACNTTKSELSRPFDRLMGEYGNKQARLSTAAIAAVSSGKTEEALLRYGELYKKNSHDEDIALNYAQLLRKTGNAGDAVRVLSPFVSTTSKARTARHIDPLTRTEYAASLIAAGDFETAETQLTKVLDNDRATELHADAMNLMGVVVDSNGAHKDAEKLFRKSMETWNSEDPTPVMNNLALNLAHRGKFDESLDILRRAQIIKPDNTRIAKNIEFVMNLRGQIIPKAPVNLKKK